MPVSIRGTTRFGKPKPTLSWSRATRFFTRRSYSAVWIGVSCDMCHPNASNTHPETYPKNQEQLQRVALLHDIINWCIENPVKGKTLDSNDPKMRALEAYILAQRKGIALAYGKH
jgi:hypothetical protein